ncbi:MAG: hypothetical protein NZ741_12705, partial [Armatimonadetes bacterium]|nr:hypothetical protein [Armatimonadota bacterium]
WLCREEQVTPALVEALQQAKAWGEEHLEQIVQREAQRLGKHEDLIRHYLFEVMQYEMTPAHEAALERFAEECLRLGLIPFSHVKQAAGSVSRL